MRTKASLFVSASSLLISSLIVVLVLRGRPVDPVHSKGIESNGLQDKRTNRDATIDHPANTNATCGGTTGSGPLDLVWTDCDPNGFPKNPRWRYQVSHNDQVPPA